MRDENGHHPVGIREARALRCAQRSLLPTMRVSGSGQRGAVRHRAELQEIATQAKEAVKDLEVNLLILEAIETGRVKSVPAEGGGEILEIDEDFIVERLSD